MHGIKSTIIKKIATFCSRIFCTIRGYAIAENVITIREQ